MWLILPYLVRALDHRYDFVRERAWGVLHTTMSRVFPGYLHPDEENLKALELAIQESQNVHTQQIVTWVQVVTGRKAWPYHSP